MFKCDSAPPAECVSLLLNNLVKRNATVKCESVVCLCLFASNLLDRFLLVRNVNAKNRNKDNSFLCTCRIKQPKSISEFSIHFVEWSSEKKFGLVLDLFAVGNADSNFWLTSDGAM